MIKINQCCFDIPRKGIDITLKNNCPGSNFDVKHNSLVGILHADRNHMRSLNSSSIVLFRKSTLKILILHV